MHSIVRRMGLTLCGAALMMVTGCVSAPASRARLSAMDYVQIQQLVHRLNLALDYCGHGGEDFADLFTPDGQYVIDDRGVLRRHVGRSQLAAVAGGPDCAVTRTEPRIHLAHLAENLVIEPTASGAHGTAYAIYPGRKGRHLQPDVAGQVGLYHDDYVRTAAGWRLQLRRHEVSPEPVLSP